jgi:hypothetical protein
MERIRKFGVIVYHHQKTLEESAISRGLKVKNCPHSWLLYRYGQTFKRPFLSMFVDGGSPSITLQLLLGDDRFAQELSRTKNPSKTWASLVSALNSNPAFDDAFTSWWQEPDRVSFSEWAATNEFSDLANR